MAQSGKNCDDTNATATRQRPDFTSTRGATLPEVAAATLKNRRGCALLQLATGKDLRQAAPGVPRARPGA